MKFLAALLCLAGFVAAYDDGQWSGEGLLESQDHEQYNGYYGSPLAYAGLYSGQYAAPLAYAGNYATPYAYIGNYAHDAAPLGYDGRVVDTPDVANAKAAHFAAYNNAAHNVGSHAVAVAPAYNGAYYHGAAPLAHDGRVVDTPEVAHAKAAHFAAHAAASHGAHAAQAYGSPIYASNYAAPVYASNYAGHYAHGAAPLGHDGRVVDTPEVAHAKAAHFAAHAAASHGAHAAQAYGSPIYAFNYAGPVYASNYAGHYAHGAAPLGHDGRVIDTPEVAHAKAAHFAAHAAASHGAHVVQVYASPIYASNYAASVYASNYAGHYAHGAAPLGHDGRVVDTPEVAHAKAAHFAALSAASHGSYYGNHY